MSVFSEVRSGEQQRVQARSYRNQAKGKSGSVSRSGFLLGAESGSRSGPGELDIIKEPTGAGQGTGKPGDKFRMGVNLCSVLEFSPDGTS
ncbi:hypothetical protein BTM36_08575 [Herbaspirillum sp. VT-16-41]|nr:hypothetical protein BTM36_08575 [Herbaspirillum sp. VT-16-41]